ncbi:hypothetical protein U1Q18_037530 [Sarracenia purpurea var. burkii]
MTRASTPIVAATENRGKGAIIGTPSFIPEVREDRSLTPSPAKVFSEAIQMQMDNDDDSDTSLEVDDEGFPAICSYCQAFGHDMENCKFQVKPVEPTEWTTVGKGKGVVSQVNIASPEAAMPSSLVLPQCVAIHNGKPTQSNNVESDRTSPGRSAATIEVIEKTIPS